MTRAISWTRRLVAVVAACGLLGVVAWCALAITFAAPIPAWAANSLAGALGVLGFAGAVGLVVRRARMATFATVGALALFFTWWASVEPSQDRDWQSDVAVLPYAVVEGDLVTVHNIRDFEYRTETDFTPRYYDKTFDLRKLDRGDIIASYWGSDDIAHMFVSFGFGEDHLAMSIETRKEVGEGYSTLAGFFKQYELFYVVADERDVIGVRTNVRADPPEDVYMYRTTAGPENLRRLFLDYVREINSLHEKPEFYNTATTNCTTNIWMHTKVNGAMPFSWKILLSGHVPELAYERGRLAGDLPFPELRRRSRINDAARAGGLDDGFSQRIRAGMP